MPNQENPIIVFGVKDVSSRVGKQTIDNIVREEAELLMASLKDSAGGVRIAMDTGCTILYAGKVAIEIGSITHTVGRPNGSNEMIHQVRVTAGYGGGKRLGLPGLLSQNGYEQIPQIIA